MQKEFADKVIADYSEKIYGFALSKLNDIDKAEELASRIVFDVYKSLLKAEEIFNVNSYVYRIASNVCVHFINEEILENQRMKDKMMAVKVDEDNREDVHAQIRKNISYLSNIQREVVVLYYYEKLKVKQIAQALNLRAGTVKWHLFEARNNLKNTLFVENEKNNPPVIFTELRSFGVLSTSMDLTDYLSRTLSQNIAYHAYKEEKTAREIAQEISIPTPFVEAEISRLVEHGFMSKMPNNKYITNIYIIEKYREKEEKIAEVSAKYAQILCDMYIPLLFDALKDSALRKEKIYTPKDDFNFLMWTMISFACAKKFQFRDNKKDIDKYMVTRKDGGINIAIATVDNKHEVHSLSPHENLTQSVDHYRSNHPRNRHPITTWMSIPLTDDRHTKHSTWVERLFDTLYDFLIGNIPHEPANIDRLLRLYENGLIISETSHSQYSNPDTYVNTIVTTAAEEELISLFPPVPEKLREISAALDEKIYRINKNYFPTHMQNLCRILNQNCFMQGQMRPFILNYLLERGILKPLKKYQKQTVNMIMFCDKLPLSQNSNNE